MISSAPVILLVAIFVIAAAVVWVAGTKLSQTTDVLSTGFGLGEAMGGVILLAIATNLPEVAITVSGAWRGDLGLAIGNILGGIAIQTVVLVVLDAVGVKGKDPLTYKAASLALVLEGVLVIAVLIVAIMATRLPPRLIFLRIAPGGLTITILWIVGLLLIGRARKGLPWHEGGAAPEGQEKPHGHSRVEAEREATKKGVSTTRSALVFALCAVATLIAGVGLEVSGEALAARVGMTGVLFGATILAAATSLPELSTGLAAVKLGDYKLAVSDIFGGNAFLPVLFLLASLISGKAVLPQAQNTDIYLAGLGVLLTCVYVYGLIFRPRTRVLGTGIDSLVVLVMYLIGIAGLVAITLHGPR